MSRPTPRRAVSMWHVLWLVVFAVDASLQGRGKSHQMGAMGLGLLLGFLVISEVVATRRESEDERL